MILSEESLEGFAEQICEKGQKLVLYGYGVIGKVTVPAYIAANNLESHVLFYVDANEDKQGQQLVMGGRRVEVYAPDRMAEIEEEFVLLITGSRYGAILEFLNGKGYLEHVHGYLFAWMLVRASRNIEPVPVIKRNFQQMIPKVIHYCWFGRGRMPDRIKSCVESWHKYCPGYEIKEWNEDNYDVSIYRYTRQAYENRKWAFVSDVARLDILYQNGGIYLDTDVELIKNLDDLLYQPAFCGVEKWRILNTGGGCGAVTHHPVWKRMLAYRAELPFVNRDGTYNLESSGSYESCPLVEDGFVPDNTVQIVDGMTVYSSDFFHPFDYMSKETAITKNTYGIHHFEGSWV